MSYLDRIKENNNYIEADKIPLIVDGKRIGQVKKEYIKYLLTHNAFELKNSHLTINKQYDTFDKRTKILNDFAHQTLKNGLTNRFMNENYPLKAKPNDKALAFIDRSISTLLGTISYGQHLNAFVQTDTGVKMWIGRRAYDKPHEPGKLDHLVAGGLPYDIELMDNLAKECYEEAGMSRELALKAKSVGIISYKFEYELGGKEDIIYCYDLELDANFKPTCTDGEVEEFYLMPIEEVANIVKSSNEFKTNCNLVIIDFLIRHGYITPKDKDYIDIIKGLRI